MKRLMEPFEIRFIPATDTMPFEQFRLPAFDENTTSFSCGATVDEGPTGKDNLFDISLEYFEKLRAALRSGRVFVVDDISEAGKEVFQESMNAVRSGRVKHPFQETYLISTINHRTRDFIYIEPFEDESFYIARFQLVNRNYAKGFSLICSGLATPTLEPLGYRMDVSLWGFSDQGREVKEMHTMLSVCASQAFLVMTMLSNSDLSTTQHGSTPEQNKLRRRLKRPERFPYVSIAPVGDYRTLIPPVTLPSQSYEHQGGTHASPIMHERRGHYCTRKGKTFWVRSTVVNPNNPGPRARSHYEVHA